MFRMLHVVICAFLAGVVVLAGCSKNTGGVNESAAPVAQQKQPEAMSLLGKPLFAPELPRDVLEARERDLETAQADYDRDPHNEEAIIWLGRRLAYLGRHRDAIDTFSNGLAIHPNSYKLLRHRGHRYLTTRTFDLALADLQRAAELIEGVPDEVEPDGQPNRLNIPTSTSHTNMYYHLGLARYLTADYEGALHAYERCMEFCRNDDMRVATAYWHYLTLRRLNRSDAAARLLSSITKDMDIIENASYHRLLLMFKDELSPETVFKAGVDNQPPDIDLATTGYGIGMWRVFQGERDKAAQQFQKIINETNWAAFGHIAAEVELARLRSR